MMLLWIENFIWRVVIVVNRSYSRVADTDACSDDDVHESNMPNTPVSRHNASCVGDRGDDDGDSQRQQMKPIVSRDQGELPDLSAEVSSQDLAELDRWYGPTPLLAPGSAGMGEEGGPDVVGLQPKCFIFNSDLVVVAAAKESISPSLAQSLDQCKGQRLLH